ncbi:unnamed protein product [Ostreobium quekettii]|uniref:Serpin domain-containing protein n=1 Tax=Ostreobium quekettii TaxID=121088 RepID=A0A8S1J771_9CHLO|nr:unnamed protein product [Ostreobium quekettii]|eukprot:evm.model.scf_3735.1 EVM.evm.TU.scf_3735.1   scf_3735:2409-5629(+)
MRALGLVALLALGSLLQSHAALRPLDCQLNDFFSRPDISTGLSGKDPAPPSVVATDVAASINSFGFNFFRNVLPTSPNGNIVFSPLSIAAAFSLLHIGAEKDTTTQQEIGVTLQFVSECYPFLLQDILDAYKNEDVAEQLSLATRLYVQERLELKPDFVEEVGEGNVEGTNFEDTDQAMEQINNWVSEQTNGFIDDLIAPGQLDPSTVMALVNALYFKGTWDLKFDVEKTTNMTFNGSNGEAQVEFMKQTQEFKYDMENNVLELPYKNSRFSMIIVLNNPDLDSSFQVDLAADALRVLDQPEFVKVSTEVTIPRFSFEESYDLKQILPELGTERVFTGDAELGVISDAPLFVDTAVHKARIQVNEEGTTAAAATNIGVVALILDEVFTADRPFTFFIRDNENKLFLFMGAYSNVET